MKRKNMISMVTSLALVGVVAVGGTLALLTSQSNDVTNTFTVGADYPAEALKVREHDVTQLATGAWNSEEGNDWKVNGSTNAYEGIQYTNLVGGTTVDKDPQFVLAEGSPKSWITCYIDGLNELRDYVTVSGVETEGLTGHWYRYNPEGETFTDKYILVDGADDIQDEAWYIFSEKVTGQGTGLTNASITDPIFTELTVDPDVAKNNAAASSGTQLADGSITVMGVAVQVVNDELTNEQAWDQVITTAAEAVDSQG